MLKVADCWKFKNNLKNQYTIFSRRYEGWFSKITWLAGNIGVSDEARQTDTRHGS